MRHRPIRVHRSTHAKGAAAREDAVRDALVIFLSEHPDATQQDCLAYLDREYPRLARYFGLDKAQRRNLMHDLYASLRRRLDQRRRR